MDEALRLATGMAVMNSGRLVQAGDPASILLAPADDFVREFLGGEALQLRLLDLVPVREAHETRQDKGNRDHCRERQSQKGSEHDAGAPPFVFMCRR